MPEDKPKKRTLGDWYLIVIGVFVGGGLLVVVSLKLLHSVGAINEPFPSAPKVAERPRFDNRECLSRNSYRIREADPLISDEMLDGAVARACVVERQRFEGR